MPGFQQLLSMVLREFGPDIVSVMVFGSRVRGGARSDSDYDMLIIMDKVNLNPNVRDERVASATANIPLGSGVRISPLVLNREEATDEAEHGSPLLSSILVNYETLHDPNGFAIELLDLVKRSRSSLTYIERGQAWNLARTV